MIIKKLIVFLDLLYFHIDIDDVGGDNKSYLLWDLLYHLSQAIEVDSLSQTTYSMIVDPSTTNNAIVE